MPESGLSILLDQNVPQECLVWLLRLRPAWTVTHVNLTGLMGRPDAEVFRWAQTNRAIIVSYDEDFADARTFPLGAHHGIIRATGLAHDRRSDHRRPAAGAGAGA